jgi:hypothetical protein
MSKKQELIDRVLNDLDNNWVVSKQDILALVHFVIHDSYKDNDDFRKAIALLNDDKRKHID